MKAKDKRWNSVLKSKRDKKKIADGSIVDAMQWLEDKVFYRDKKKVKKDELIKNMDEIFGDRHIHIK